MMVQDVTMGAVMVEVVAFLTSPLMTGLILALVAMVVCGPAIRLLWCLAREDRRDEGWRGSEEVAEWYDPAVTMPLPMLPDDVSQRLHLVK